ncbi:MAG TPA: class I SAM-dependent methyltransferase [Chthoniobacterales bacterium]|jgi:trans-aconitate methyltransferase
MSQTIETQPRFVPPAISSEPAELSSNRVAEFDTAGSNSAAPFAEADDSLFDRLAWVYVFFREKIFRDDTERMINQLWPDGAPPAGTRMIELGCGPGFYSCGFAARFPQISVLGVDRAARQLECAHRKARKLRLQNCRFESDDVLDLSHSDGSFNLLLAARLFTVLPDQHRAVAEMHRVLRSGGRCIVAEPRFAFWASLPLRAMRLLARLSGSSNRCREPQRAIVLSPREFRSLFSSQPWRSVKVWQDGRYQYALCEKV